MTYTATEKSDDIVSASRASCDVEIEGQTLWLPDDFIKAEATCIQETVAGITIDMKGLKDQFAELNQFLKNHRGPPVNQDLIRDMDQASSELTNELRLGVSKQRWI
jgi:hypothetical protein